MFASVVAALTLFIGPPFHTAPQEAAWISAQHNAGYNCWPEMHNYTKSRKGWREWICEAR